MGEGVRLRESIVLHGATLQVGTRRTVVCNIPKKAEGEGPGMPPRARRVSPRL